MARSYDMTNRDRASDESRRTIVEAAHRLLERPDGGSLTLQEVAKEAGVSRATIYNRIGSRRDLLTAVFEDQGRIIEFDRVLRAMLLADPLEALVETVREGCRAWEVIPTAIRRTLALAVLDDEIGELVAQFEGYRRGEISALANRVLKHSSVTIAPRRATATLVLVTSFGAHDQLRRGHSPDECSDFLTHLALETVGAHREAAHG